MPLGQSGRSVAQERLVSQAGEACTDQELFVHVQDGKSHLINLDQMVKQARSGAQP
jgi:hypothetical protein